MFYSVTQMIRSVVVDGPIVLFVADQGSLELVYIQRVFVFIAPVTHPLEIMDLFMSLIYGR